MQSKYSEHFSRRRQVEKEKLRHREEEQENRNRRDPSRDSLYRDSADGRRGSVNDKRLAREERVDARETRV